MPFLSAVRCRGTFVRYGGGRHINLTVTVWADVTSRQAAGLLSVTAKLLTVTVNLASWPAIALLAGLAIARYSPLQ